MPASAPSAECDPVALLDAAFRRAIVEALGDAYADADPAVRASQRAEHGDFQANGAMALARRAGLNPRDVAQRIVDALDVEALAEPPEVAGPGFINVHLRTEALGRLLDAIDDESLGVEPDLDVHAVVIDLCSVNVAKQMHVGHLRSTIIGDALARVFERRGRTVSRENHLGDWGLPIAMVLRWLRERGVNPSTIDLPALDAAYRDAQLEVKFDEKGLDAARRLGAGPHRLVELEEQQRGAEEALADAKRTLVALQRGEQPYLGEWERLVECTLRALDEALVILGVKLGREHNRGESFYRDRLPRVVDDFCARGLAALDDGATVVRFADRERPLLIRKSDGAFLYATTDLAAVRFRTHELGADRIIYVVDARQRDHFRDVFDAARLIGWDLTPDGTRAQLVHVGFGAVLGTDKRPLKTRSGDNVTLRALLDEACERGSAEVRMRARAADAPTHGLPDAELDRIGRAVGIAAIKYADLSSDLVRDYVFDLDRMIAFEGDTGPYLQYAHARICSIFARAGVEARDLRGSPFVIDTPAEKQLALVLLRFAGVVRDVQASLEPHRLCAYLAELAGAYSTFYQNCPVLRAEDERVRRSRLRQSDLVRRVLADGLDLLGIEAPARM